MVSRPVRSVYESTCFTTSTTSGSLSPAPSQKRRMRVMSSISSLAGNCFPQRCRGNNSSAAHFASRSSWTISCPLDLSSAVMVASRMAGCPSSCT